MFERCAVKNGYNGNIQIHHLFRRFFRPTHRVGLDGRRLARRITTKKDGHQNTQYRWPTTNRLTGPHVCSQPYALNTTDGSKRESSSTSSDASRRTKTTSKNSSLPFALRFCIAKQRPQRKRKRRASLLITKIPDGDSLFST